MFRTVRGLVRNLIMVGKLNFCGRFTKVLLLDEKSRNVWGKGLEN